MMLCSRPARFMPVGLALATAGFLGSFAAGAAIVPSVAVSTDWDSAYVSEGRDNLDGADLLSGTASVEAMGFAFTAWYGSSHSADYRELNLSLERGFSLGPVELALGYTRIDYPRSDAPADNEFSAVLALDLPRGIVAEAGGRYATESKGAFFEARLSRDWAFWEDRVMCTPHVMAGFDAGYASEEFDGANHIEAGLAVAVPLLARLTLTARLAHCWALRDMRDSGFHDVTWGGVGLSLAF